MLAYLSEEWIHEADAALRASGLCTSDGDRFVVEQRVGEVVFHMVFDGDGASVRSGPAIEPSVIFCQNRETAVAVAKGDLSAEDAVLNGGITFEGDPLALLNHRHLLSNAGDVFAKVRTCTNWG